MDWQIKRRADLARGAEAAAKPASIRPLAYPGDGNAHEWVVTVTDDGAPVDLTGATVTGYFYRHADGASPFAMGTVTGNVATVQIPSGAYELGGYVTGILRAAKGDVLMTLDSIVFAVGPNVTGEIIDPGTVIQDIDALVAAIHEAVASIPEDYTALEDDVDVLKSAVSSMTTATVTDEGKALKAKTVTNGKVTEWEFGEAGGGLTATQANLLLTILGEGVYGSDQEANIELLRKALMDIAPVSISAVLESTPLVGLYYADLEFTVTATFDDASTMVVDGYRIVTPGAVVLGSNTVTLAYRGVATDVTFAASSEQTYTIDYRLTNVDVSNKNYLVISGERYETTLSVDNDHYIASVIVTMGGIDITETVFVNNTVTIAEVVGNVIITANAEEYVYLDNLMQTSAAGLSRCDGYPNGVSTDAQIIGGAYYYSAFVTRYPALHDCIIRWKIKNITENDLPLISCGFGSIDSDSYNNLDTISTIKAYYCVKVDNASHTLSPGGELEGTVSCKAGWQLCFICKFEDYSKYNIELVGNFESDTFSGYTEVNPTNANTTEFGGYRTINFYRDDGSDLIGEYNTTPRKLGIALDAGTYDVYCATEVSDFTPWGASRVSVACGGMMENTDTNVYYGCGFKNGYLHSSIWHHLRMTLGNNGMSVVTPALGNDVGQSVNIRLLFKKVVTE